MKIVDHFFLLCAPLKAFMLLKVTINLIILSKEGCVASEESQHGFGAGCSFAAL